MVMAVNRLMHDSQVIRFVAHSKYSRRSEDQSVSSI